VGSPDPVGQPVITSDSSSEVSVRTVSCDSDSARFLGDLKDEMGRRVCLRIESLPLCDKCLRICGTNVSSKQTARAGQQSRESLGGTVGGFDPVGQPATASESSFELSVRTVSCDNCSSRFLGDLKIEIRRRCCVRIESLLVR
jgi:DNA helicase HerA-like ATPase